MRKHTFRLTIDSTPKERNQTLIELGYGYKMCIMQSKGLSSDRESIVRVNVAIAEICAPIQSIWRKRAIVNVGDICNIECRIGNGDDKKDFWIKTEMTITGK